MLHTIWPCTPILASIWIGVSSETMFFIELVFTFITTAILPDIGAFTMHNSTFEFSLKVSPICPFKASLTAHLIFRPVTCILTSIGPEVDTLTLFLSIIKASKIIATITPHFNAFTILLIWLQPIWIGLCSHITLPIHVVYHIILSENAEVRSLILLPDTFEYLILHTAEHTNSNCLSIDPVPLKSAIVWPY